jgi:hypothetical protein
MDPDDPRGVWLRGKVGVGLVLFLFDFYFLKNLYLAAPPYFALHDIVEKKRKKRKRGNLKCGLKTQHHRDGVALEVCFESSAQFCQQRIVIGFKAIAKAKSALKQKCFKAVALKPKALKPKPALRSQSMFLPRMSCSCEKWLVNL